VNIIKLKPSLMDLVDNGSKTATTRLGLKTKYTLGPVKFQNSEVAEDLIDIGAEIYKIESISFCDISDKLAEIENYKSASELKKALTNIYGFIDEFETLTVIYWYR